jgi:YHS domain-containing protein
MRMSRCRIRTHLAALGTAAVAVLLSISPAVRPIRADAPPASGRRADQETLKAYGPLVGSWRGVGQVEQGKARGAWTESAAWAWKLTKDSAALEVTVAKGKHLKSALLRPGKEPGTLAFDAVLADGSKRSFTGKTAGSRENKPLVLTADAKGPAEGPRRVTITPLHDTRLLLLLEAEDPERHVYYRLGQVGYTREGVNFAAGESYPLCIVTEGKGTMQVSHNGKTYWVCCSGCRDLFNDNPEAVLSEAAERDKAKDKK